MSGLYDKGRADFLTGAYDWTAGGTAFKVSLHAAGYVVNLVTHDFYDDLTNEVTNGNAAIATRTQAAGVADAVDTTLSSVSGAQVTQLVIWQDTTVTTTSALIAHINSGTGLPVTPNGGDITVQWDSGANKIFKL